jgi:simple sugar transport system permease protein
VNPSTSYDLIAGFIDSILRVSTPILIASLGELVGELSGVINLGLEGIMLAGAFSGFCLCYFFDSAVLGIIGALFTGAILGLTMAFLSIRLKTNQIVTGFGLWILCQGLVGFAFRKIFGVVIKPPSIPGLIDTPIPVLSSIPLLGETFFSQNAIVYFSWLLVVCIFFILKYTSWGLRIKAVGESPAVAEAAGINYALVRYSAVAFGGAMAGLAGAYLTLGVLHFFTDGMIAGLGFISVAVVFFSRWRPFWAMIGAVVFAASSALQYRLQAIEFPLPYQILLMLPYLVTILFLILFVRGESAPASLGEAYEKEKT